MIDIHSCSDCVNGYSNYAKVWFKLNCWVIDCSHRLTGIVSLSPSLCGSASSSFCRSAETTRRQQTTGNKRGVERISRALSFAGRLFACLSLRLQQVLQCMSANYSFLSHVTGENLVPEPTNEVEEQQRARTPVSRRDSGTDSSDQKQPEPRPDGRRHRFWEDESGE